MLTKTVCTACYEKHPDWEQKCMKPLRVPQPCDLCGTTTDDLYLVVQPARPVMIRT